MPSWGVNMPFWEVINSAILLFLLCCCWFTRPWESSYFKKHHVLFLGVRTETVVAAESLRLRKPQHFNPWQLVKLVICCIPTHVWHVHSTSPSSLTSCFRYQMCFDLWQNLHPDMAGWSEWQTLLLFVGDREKLRCNDGVVCTWASCKKTTTTTTTDHVSDPTALSSPERPSSFWRSGLVPPADTAAPSGTHSSRCWLDTGALPWPAGGSTLFTASNDWCFEQPVNLAYSNDNSQYCCILHHPFPSPSGSTTEKTQRIHFVSLLTDFLNRFTSEGAALHVTLWLKDTRGCWLTRYSNFTSRYLRMVSLVSGMALWRYVFRSWSIWTTTVILVSHVMRSEHDRDTIEESRAGSTLDFFVIKQRCALCFY